jgi:hypothetical protein
MASRPPSIPFFFLDFFALNFSILNFEISMGKPTPLRHGTTKPPSFSVRIVSTVAKHTKQSVLRSSVAAFASHQLASFNPRREGDEIRGCLSSEHGTTKTRPSPFVG